MSNLLDASITFCLILMHVMTYCIQIPPEAETLRLVYCKDLQHFARQIVPPSIEEVG